MGKYKMLQFTVYYKLALPKVYIFIFKVNLCGDHFLTKCFQIWEFLGSLTSVKKIPYLITFLLERRDLRIKINI